MDRRFLVGVLLVSLACSSKQSGGKGGAQGSAGEGGSATGGKGSGTGGATGGSGGGSAGAGGTAGNTGGMAGSTGGMAGGTGGTGGTAGGAGGTPVPGGASVLERNNNPSRDGHFLQPRLTKATAARMVFDAGFAAMFPGNMWASPLYFEN